MSRRTERVGKLIRNIIGQMLLSKLSDPRIDPARTSVMHVEVTDDFLTAKVYVSVIGTEPEQRRTLRALKSARGHIQELLGREITLRNTPVLEFLPDAKVKKTLQTLELISQAMSEIEEREQSQPTTEDTTDAPEGDEE